MPNWGDEPMWLPSSEATAHDEFRRGWVDALLWVLFVAVIAAVLVIGLHPEWKW